MTKRFIAICLLCLGLSFAGGYELANIAQASSHTSTVSGQSCGKKGETRSCLFAAGWVSNISMITGSYSSNVQGFSGSEFFGFSPSYVKAEMCLSPSASMWASGSSCWTVYDNKIGNGSDSPGISRSNTDPNQHYTVMQFYAEDALWSNISISATGTEPVKPPPPPPLPGLVNLDFYVKNQNNQPIGGAYVHIEQDFGNGTDRSSDGNGLANFGVAPNITLGYYVSAANCTGPGGSSGVNASIWTDDGATANVTLTCSVNNPPPGPSGCPAITNCLGDTLTGPAGFQMCMSNLDIKTCQSNGTWNNEGYSSVCANACPPPPSACPAVSNCLGDTSTGPAGYEMCQSQTTSKICQSNGTWLLGSSSNCNVCPPTCVAGYGTACPSSANACGLTQSNGTWQCDGSCSSTVPLDSSCPAPSASVVCPSSAITYGTSTTVSWSANSNTLSCTINGANASVPTGSLSTGNLTSNTLYNLNCSGYGGQTANNSCTVQVGAAPVMNYLRCNGVNTPGTCAVDYNGTASITWSSSNTTNCSLVSTVPTDEGVGSSGTNNYAGIIANRDYSIECWNSDSGVHAPALPLPLHVVITGPSVDIKANNSNGPITLAWNTSANLSWTSTSAGSCNALGDWSGAKALNSSQSTGNLIIPKTYNYTLACSGNGSAPDTVQVILNPPVPNNPTKVVTTAPNYCMSGPAATVTWTYSDPSGSPQSAREIEIDDQPSFNSPEFDSGKDINGLTSIFTGQGVLQFNKNYKTRVRVWNSYDVVSGWTTEPGNFDTPPYAYPQVDFYWTANGIQNNPSPPLNKPVVFTDQTVFNGNSNGREWDWLFGDGGSSTTQNPSHTYSTEGSYYVTLTATDNANQACSRTKGPLIIQKPIPRWREIAPR